MFQRERADGLLNCINLPGTTSPARLSHFPVPFHGARNKVYADKAEKGDDDSDDNNDNSRVR